MTLKEDANSIDCTDPEFVLDNNLNIDDLFFMIKIKVNFYQLWTIFRELPKTYRSKNCKYAWYFLHKPTGIIISIFDWKNEERFLNTKSWHIGASVNDKNVIREFVKTLFEAVRVYEKWYRIPIEQKTFKSDNPKVQMILQDIKVSIVKNKEILNSL